LSIQAVIFDCDGVVVDSEILSKQAMATAMTQAGLSMTPQQCLERFMGIAEDQIVKHMDQPPDKALKILEDYHQRLDQMIEDQLQPVPGALTFIETLSQQGIPFAMASNSQRAKMLKTLGKTGALAWLEGRYFGRDDVSLGKPAPELYLKASDFLQVAPKHCLVIEDSLAGATAGLKAGCRVWALVREGSSDAHLELGCERAFRDYSELQQAFLAQL
jgi:HAD superfamily hydrolase (TIGR01509 family)